MKKTFHLAENIAKYLKYMELVKSASSLTLKHYRLDLSQAFERDIFSHNESGLWSEVDILTSARAAFQGWSDLSLASRNRKAATLKSFFSWAFEHNLTETDLSFQITCPKVPRKIPHFISVDEAMAVLKSFVTVTVTGTISDTDTGTVAVTDQGLEDNKLLVEKILFLIIYGGGLRVSEACNLKWSQINFSKKVIAVLGKGGKERIIALPSICFNELKAWKKSSAFNEYVFSDKPLNPRTAYNMIQRCGARAGLLKPLHPHALRHSFATHLLTSGANLRTLQELLGHESLTATEKYTHLSIDQLARTMESLHPLGKGK